MFKRSIQSQAAKKTRAKPKSRTNRSATNFVESQGNLRTNRSALQVENAERKQRNIIEFLNNVSQFQNIETLRNTFPRFKEINPDFEGSVHNYVQYVRSYKPPFSQSASNSRRATSRNSPRAPVSASVSAHSVNPFNVPPQSASNSRRATSRNSPIAPVSAFTEDSFSINSFGSFNEPAQSASNSRGATSRNSPRAPVSSFTEDPFLINSFGSFNEPAQSASNSRGTTSRKLSSAPLNSFNSFQVNLFSEEPAQSASNLRRATSRNSPRAPVTAHTANPFNELAQSASNSRRATSGNLPRAHTEDSFSINSFGPFNEPAQSASNSRRATSGNLPRAPVTARKNPFNDPAWFTSNSSNATSRNSPTAPVNARENPFSINSFGSFNKPPESAPLSEQHTTMSLSTRCKQRKTMMSRVRNVASSFGQALGFGKTRKSASESSTGNKTPADQRHGAFETEGDAAGNGRNRSYARKRTGSNGNNGRPPSNRSRNVAGAGGQQNSLNNANRHYRELNRIRREIEELNFTGKDENEISDLFLNIHPSLVLERIDFLKKLISEHRSVGAGAGAGANNNEFINRVKKIIKQKMLISEKKQHYVNLDLINNVGYLKQLDKDRNRREQVSYILENVDKYFELARLLLNRPPNRQRPINIRNTSNRNFIQLVEQARENINRVNIDIQSIRNKIILVNKYKEFLRGVKTNRLSNEDIKNSIKNGIVLLQLQNFNRVTGLNLEPNQYEYLILQFAGKRINTEDLRTLQLIQYLDYLLLINNINFEKSESFENFIGKKIYDTFMLKSQSTEFYNTEIKDCLTTVGGQGSGSLKNFTHYFSRLNPPYRITDVLGDGFCSIWAFGFGYFMNNPNQDFKNTRIKPFINLALNFMYAKGMTTKEECFTPHLFLLAIHYFMFWIGNYYLEKIISGTNKYDLINLLEIPYLPEYPEDFDESLNRLYILSNELTDFEKAKRTNFGYKFFCRYTELGQIFNTPQDFEHDILQFFLTPEIAFNASVNTVDTAIFDVLSYLLDQARCLYYFGGVGKGLERGADPQAQYKYTGNPNNNFKPVINIYGSGGHFQSINLKELYEPYNLSTKSIGNNDFATYYWRNMFKNPIWTGYPN